MSVRLFPKRTVRTAFVLGGGGNLGSIQVGMLQALFEAGITPDVVIGCSVGALNAAGVAADPTLDGVHNMRRTWLELTGDELFPSGRISGLWMLGRKGHAIQPNSGLRDLIARALPFERLEDAAIPVHVNATSLVTGRGHWFTEGPAEQAILASAALPAVFPPVLINGEPYIDGGVVDNVPISRALYLGAQHIYVLHVGNFSRPRQLPKRPIDVLLQSFSIARNHRFLAETDEPPEGVDLVVLPGIDPGRIRRNDFSRSRELMARAHAASSAFLAEREAAAAGS